MLSNTCILYFSRTPEGESRHKQVLKHATANQKLLRELYQQTRKKLAQSGLPLRELTETAQQGDDFGTRLTNGLAALFAEGYEQIIVVGNDCPELRATDLQAAHGSLQAGSQVIGPEKQGGTYLIGVQKSTFHPETFQSLPWNTTELGTALQELFADQGALSLLSPKSGLNDEANFRFLLSTKPNLVFSRRLRHLLTGEVPSWEKPYFWNQPLLGGYLHFRGPPAV